MPEGKEQTTNGLKKYFPALILIGVIILSVHLISRYTDKIGSVILAIMGLGIVVLVHELGHFIFAKLAGIKVESFSIFISPVLLGMRRTEQGFRVRILPMFFPKDNDPDDDGRISFTFGKSTKAGETEYRIGLIPFGGFVGMLGQEDVGAAEKSDDPRSFANAAIWKRAVVISAGVVFNVLLAAIIFMSVFMVGIKMPPAIVGDVVADSPAARAGLQSGDEVIEIDGKTDLDFTSIAVAAALSDKNEAIALKVKKLDGSITDVELVAEQLPGSKVREFGISPAVSLTVANVADADYLFEKTGLKSGDEIVAVVGRNIERSSEINEIVSNIFEPSVTVTADRIDANSGAGELVRASLALNLRCVDSYDIRNESELGHICSIVPRLKITSVQSKETAAILQPSDIIIKVADVANPTFKELREVTNQYADKNLPVTVLRADSKGEYNSVDVVVKPAFVEDVNRVLIGIGVALDAEHPVAAKTIAGATGPQPLPIPRGATITAVNAQKVSNFYDIIKFIRKAEAGKVILEYRTDKNITDKVALDIPADNDFITVKSSLAEIVPFEPLKRIYKATGPIDAIAMGCKKTIMFIVQSYVTIKGLVMGLISPQNLIGPVGMIAVGSQIVAQRQFIRYLYLQGLISACLAVMNFLPLPVFDGGHIVLLIVEKIKGRSLSRRTQSIIAYIGLVLIISLILYITGNDIYRTFLK